ncbi:casein kinase I isoform alpha, putative [Entamoeba invadens IP1]|uniref:non-specific serine/threonine protein kinase n=1 Tax=Entamoeba invadens IP1 TaxID=370355 RepID=A0A0A1UBE9_ENTIV|nr:casein kinase I isoform alpha, putative [Entamoeba invadens IP1]ELP89559.1 casein kinase I isoform alpha, putative [Entamoeba invadens IP1]|eukprot:XP_004256330.1 casein kinase I isoform alpha, putative [Entamoeba invadens IP1]
MSRADFVIHDIYKLEKKLGGGSFGDVFQGLDITNKTQVAIKIELKSCKHPQLLAEAALYKYLAEGNEGPGLTKVFYTGVQDDYNVMVMEFLGPSLEDLLQYVSKPFSLKTVLMIVDQCLTCIERVHKKFYIHRDIKPDNFVMGSGANVHYVYIIDFGLSKKYMENGVHIPYTEDKSLTGTARYASINNHKGYEQSRRDDLESLAYMFIYFLQGKLPWQGFSRQNNTEKFDKILKKKEEINLDELCAGLPLEFKTFLMYSRGLRFEEEPRYQFWRESFQNVARENGIDYDGDFDWYNTKK